MQGVLCPSCGTMSPANAVECPQCGTTLFTSGDRTHVKARYDEMAGRTIDESAESMDDERVFTPEQRTQPHPGAPTTSTSRRRQSKPGDMPVGSDSTLPWKSASQTLGGDLSYGAAQALADAGPELDKVKVQTP